MNSFFFGNINILTFEIPIIVLLIILIDIGIFTGFGIYLTNRANSLIKSLNSIADLKDRNDIKQRMESATFQGKLFLLDLWEEFQETREADRIFNRNTIIAPNLNLGMINAIPGILTGLGLLGTFIALLIGLHHVKVQAGGAVTGIDGLINGLSGKFVSSIVALLLSLIFTMYEKVKFEELDRACSNLHNKLIRIFPKKAIDSVLLEILKQLEKQIIKEESGTQDDKIIEFLQVNFDRVNANLEKSIKQISEGASKEIVNALKDVISRFNEEIASSFGDNFKQLNSAVFKLVEWQDKYSASLKVMQETLENAVSSIVQADESLTEIASKNGQIIEVYQLFTDVIDKYQEQALLMNTRMMSQIELSEIMKKGIDEALESLHQCTGAFSHIQKELPKSLGSLEHSLVKLSEGFKNDYKTFLEYYKNLVISNE